MQQWAWRKTKPIFSLISSLEKEIALEQDELKDQSTTLETYRSFPELSQWGLVIIYY